MVVAAPALGKLATLDRPRFLLLDLPKKPFADRLEQLRTERSPFFSEWMAITDYVRPRRGRYLKRHGATADDRGSAKIINPTATWASRTLKNGMQSGVSSPARPWFRLTTPDPDLAESGAVKDYLTAVSRRMGEVFSRSNFYNSLHTGYGDLGDFGQSVMVIDEDFQDVIRCHVYSPGEYFLGVDARGMVTTLYREFAVTVSQAIQRWGSNVSATVRNMYDNNHTEAWVDIVEAIEPNMQQVRGLRGPRGAPYLRAYYEAGADADKLLAVNGYQEFPACCPRWDLQSGDVYGSGPGLDILADVKSLQTIEVRKSIIIDKMATPPTQGPGSLAANLKVNHKAGAHTFVNETSAGAGSRGITPLYEMNGQAGTWISSEIRIMEERIKEGYYADLFLMLSQSDRREITAREVDERHEEKLLALGPVLERLHNENLDPAITRTFNIMHRAGILPDPPPELVETNLKVQFISLLAQAQRAAGIGSIENTFAFAGRLASVFPSIVDKLDADQALDEYSDATGLPPGIVLADDKVETIRADKAKAAQGGAAAAAIPQAADTANVLANTPVSDNSMLSRVLGTAGALQQ